MATSLPPRGAVPVEQTWDLASVYPSDAAWDAAMADALAALPEAGRFAGRLADAGTLLEALAERDHWETLAWRLRTYAALQAKADQTDPAGVAHTQQALGLLDRVAGTFAYLEPEILAMDRDHLATLVAAEPGLAVYAHYFDTLQRRQAHVRAAEVEEALAAAGALAAAPYETYKALANAELGFGSVSTRGGRAVEV
ncbi:MAG TPA: hypothetical protein VM536_18070, partial [Chloroflexia bacterium]|nr:hypothetical protein [Chloroflexia bacterium]